MKKNILIGGAWPYANNALHIGHLAALLPGDVIARYFRGCDANVVYVSGTDCHGTPITLRAKKENIEPITIASKYNEEFKNSFNSLDFSYDFYSATMSAEHKEQVKLFYQIILDNGYIYELEEEQDFCPKCNEYLSDREIIGLCPHCGGAAQGDQCDNCLAVLNPNEIKDKHCKTCNTLTTIKKNKHLYFKLSAFQDILTKFVNANESNWRKNAVNETKKYLNLGLIDRATTRQLNWGVDVPVLGYEDKKIYVWIEAVLGYLTASTKVLKERNITLDDFLTDSSNLKTYFVHGKDNIIFHTIIYPALLQAINPKWQLPKYIISCEYVNMNDEKMSKSKGNLITIDDLVNIYNKDTIRYYMIANGPEKKDINFSSNDLIAVHNKSLVGVLGNFINRNLSFINKKFDGVITEAKIDEEIINKTKALYDKVGSLIETGELRSALENVMEYATLGNKYYDEKTPWLQVKEDINAFNETTYTCVYIMANLANLLNPFIPTTANKIKTMLNLDSFKWEVCHLKGNIKINNIELLFDRIDI
ncbi:MAG: methionine--tRNA ligase [Bacilli bacterium]